MSTQMLDELLEELRSGNFQGVASDIVQIIFDDVDDLVQPLAEKAEYFCCPRCHRHSRPHRIRIRHRLHFTLTLLTAGLWSISWLSAIAGRFRWPYLCKRCGLRLSTCSLKTKPALEASAKDPRRPVPDASAQALSADNPHEIAGEDAPEICPSILVS